MCNTPGKNAVAVAELTMGLIAAIDRRIPDAVARPAVGPVAQEGVRQGARAWRAAPWGSSGSVTSGWRWRVRAAAFGMRLVIEERPEPFGPAARPDRHSWTSPSSIASDLLSTADIVTIHVPATTETVGMVSADFLSRLRPGAVLVNTSRGDIVDEDALLAAIDEKGLWVGLDVFADEPAGGTAEFD